LFAAANTDTSVTISTTAARYTVARTIPADSKGFSLEFALGAHVNTDGLEITGIQLELGTVTEFEHRSFGEELALCQRYCFVMAPSTNAAVAPAFARTTTVAFGIAELPVTMRATPTLAFSSNTDFQVQYLGSVATSTAMAASPELHKNMIAFTTTVGSGLTAGQGMYIRDVNGGATITASAEL